ncbi:hypothetical protein N7492_009551 [Penicillium capsulatum]|uniref:Uncharacterized protein n=1 Tax=Penicillium capsulatum TaxID=69766 RepID=A0A9W9LI02_9EURO|nr:hypothetical protein N7492_009551 [Penicillium capsulatum]KAJ6106940.1 hypothetical protein N7512_010457 [Penicillium capsulatum]
MTDDPRRHWHGNPGDRHEHLNVWVQGGPKGPSPRAAWALTPEMMRRDSSTSTASTGSTVNAAPTVNANANANANTNANAGTASNASPTFPSISERRRSSAGSGAGLFANLQSQKRESGDPDMVTRRASWNDQMQKGGVFSKLWNGYTRGK